MEKINNTWVLIRRVKNVLVRYKVLSWLNQFSVYYVNAFAVEIGTKLPNDVVEAMLDNFVQCRLVSMKVKHGAALYRLNDRGKAELFRLETEIYECAK